MIPGVHRNVSAILTELPGGTFALFDAGEGSFSQIKMKYGPYTGHILQRLEMIIISHLHGDHFFGIFKIIEERQLELQKVGLENKPCYLILPKNSICFFINYLAHIRHLDVQVICVDDLRNDQSKSVFEYNYDQKVILQETEKNDTYVGIHNPNTYRGPQYQDPEMETAMASLYNLFPKNITLEKLEKFLAARKISKFLMPRVMHCPDSYGIVLETQNGFKITYSGDCRPSNELVRAGKNCTVCIHEATFDDDPDKLKMARLKQHSTISEALQVSENMKAEFTILTHFSQRYNLFRTSDKDDISDNEDDSDTDGITIGVDNKILLNRFLRKSVMAVDFMSVNEVNLKSMPWVNLYLNKNLIGDFSKYLKELQAD